MTRVFILAALLALVAGNATAIAITDWSLPSMPSLVHSHDGGKTFHRH